MSIVDFLLHPLLFRSTSYGGGTVCSTDFFELRRVRERKGSYSGYLLFLIGYVSVKRDAKVNAAQRKKVFRSCIILRESKEK